jgi:FMN phosphatase YigB (HAD superfamily)
VIRLVVTDLDNTVYDWLGSHVPAFEAQVAEMVRLTGIGEHELLDSYRRVHQRVHTSEYAYAFLELDVLDELDAGLPPGERLDRYGSALVAYREEHLRRLALYEGVEETLMTLRDRGVMVVAHTDAMMFYASLRVSILGLAPLVDGLFAPADHSWPADVGRPFAELFGDPATRRSSVGIQEEFPRHLLKPNPEVLWRILRRFAVPPEEVLYLGDSLAKDVRVAQRAGVHDVHAAHGLSVGSPLYERLVAVTHWSADDVRHERQLSEERVVPTTQISAYRELLEVIEELDAGPSSFESGVPPAARIPSSVT